MSLNHSKNNENTFSIGADAGRKTFVVGNPQGKIGMIIVEGSGQFAKKDFSSVLNRFGNINELKNRDFQQAVEDLSK